MNLIFLNIHQNIKSFNRDISSSNSAVLGSGIEVYLHVLAEVSLVLLDSLRGLFPSSSPFCGVFGTGVRNQVNNEAGNLDVVDGDGVSRQELLVSWQKHLQFLIELGHPLIDQRLELSIPILALGPNLRSNLDQHVLENKLSHGIGLGIQERIGRSELWVQVCDVVHDCGLLSKDSAVSKFQHRKLTIR